MKLRLVLSAVLLILLGIACAGCGAKGWDESSLSVSRIYVQPRTPTAGSAAIVFVVYESVSPYDTVDSWQEYGPDPPEVTTSAGSLSEVTGLQLYNLRMNHGGVHWFYNWQTPSTPQIVVIKAWYPDGGKSKKVEVLPAP